MSDETLDSVNETLVQRFEQAWKAESHPDVQNFLPPKSDLSYLATLEELVCIDIEFALKHVAATAGSNPPSLAVIERYLPRFTELTDSRILKRLIREEAVVRGRLGYDAPYTEYQCRFPGAIEKSDLKTRDNRSAVVPTASWNLRFGLLALQNGLISRDQLVAAFAKWTSDKSTPLDQLLVDDGALDETASRTLRQLMEVHIQRHGGDPQQTLMSLSGSDLPAAKAALAELEDTDLLRSIAALPAIDSIATHPQAVGRVTGEGGRFRILRRLPGAKGGMGVISVARDEELGRQVALKQIIANMADHAVYRQKFQVEAEITGNLEHPGIVPIYGLGVGADGRPYYAMRLVHGDNLSVRINQFHEARADGAVDYNSVEFHGLVDRLIDVAQAIRYAHSRGVLHRDLKPGNILVGNYGETLVIDWGLARLPLAEEQESEDSVSHASPDSQAPLNIRSGSHVDATLQGQILGTVGYAPPEQLNGRVDLITERSDVYALGAILYQILVGKTPVTSEESNLDDLIKDTIAGKITPPRRLRGTIPKSLSAVCMQALQRESADRYESVEAFISEIERWKADQPVNAAPDSIADRLMRLARRYRSAALAAAVALLGIAIVAGGALVLVNRARLNETAARKKAETLTKEKTQLAEEKTVLADRNQAVVNSFVAAFRSADPENEGVTSSMTAVEVLEQALEQIETGEELAKDALTKATLLEAIGSSLSSLGAFNRAISAEEETLRLRKAKLGGDHPDTLASMNNLASVYQAAGRLTEALPLFEETLRLRKAKLGDDHHDTLNSMNNLAGVYQDAGRLTEALPLYEATLRLKKNKLGDDHPDTLASMNNLAHSYQASGRLAEALPLYEETLRLNKAKLGDDHPGTLVSMNNLALGYRDAGRLAEALPVFEETLRLRKAKLGDDHPDTLASMNNLALGYHYAGRLAEALPLYEETLRLRKAKLGDDHPNTLVSMNNLAGGYQDAGRLTEALPLYEETLRLNRAKLGNDHPQTLVSMNSLAFSYQAAGRLAEALPLYEETVKLMKAKLGPTHPHALIGMNNLASVYADAGRLTEAVPLYEETLRLRKAKLGDDHPDSLISMNNLASVYADAGRLTEALPLSEQTLRLAKAKLGDEHPSTLSAVRGLQAALLDAGKFEEAKRHVEDWIRVLQRSATPDRRQLALAEISLAEALLGIQDYAEARERINVALKRDEIDDVQRLRALSIKGAVLASEAKWEEAEPLLVDSAEALAKELTELEPVYRWYVRRACERVITMYAARDKSEEVEKWKGELAEVIAQIERLRNHGMAPHADETDTNGL